MRVVAISIYPERAKKHIKTSGVASYTKNLLKNIPLRADDELYVVCDRFDKCSEEYKEDGFIVKRVFDRGVFFFWQIYKAVRDIKPDVVHIQQEVPLYGGIHTAYMLQWLVWLLRKYQVIITLHHVVSLEKIDRQFVQANKSSMPVWLVRRAFRVIYTPLIHYAERVIVHEPYFKDILLNEYGVTESEKIVPIPHGVEDFSPIDKLPARRAVNITPDRHVVLFMGYLAGYKGFDLLLDGFAEYAKNDSKALLIIGSGMHPKFEHDDEYRREYKAKQAKAATLLRPDQYTWLGFIKESEIADYYSASDVSLFPYTISMSSSGPMSIAMGYERAFLASDVFKAVLPAELLFERSVSSVAVKLQDLFVHQRQYTDIAAVLKQERLWTTVGERTYAVYEGGEDETQGSFAARRVRTD